MSGLARIARLHRMDLGTWERHANPWSVWTRVPILPVAVAVLLARESLGPWTVVGIAGLGLWAWVNPRVFPPPRSTGSRAARAVIGKRIWLARDEIGIPAGEARPVRGAIALSLAGLPFLAWGLWWLVPAVALLGLALSLAGKIWFLARMVRVADAMRDHPACRTWFR